MSSLISGLRKGKLMVCFWPQLLCLRTFNHGCHDFSATHVIIRSWCSLGQSLSVVFGGDLRALGRRLLRQKWGNFGLK